MDLALLLQRYQAREGRPGKPPIDVRILITLWLYATDQGVTTASHLDRLCRHHDVYRWICGGVTVNPHSLSDFRVDHLDWLLHQFRLTVADLIDEGLVALDRVGQDGLRVRAHAGSASLKRQPTLHAHLTQAEQRRQQVHALDQAEAATRGRRKRTHRQAACLRGVRQRCRRLRQALAEIGPLAEAREQRQKGDGAKTRISETDPDCRKMKMADGGYRPAYNVQVATDLDALVIVGVDVTNAGSDAGQMVPMVAQIESDYQQLPKEYYVDGSFATTEDIETVSAKGVVVYAPLKEEEEQKAKGIDPYTAKKGDGAGVAAWRQRMGTEEGKTKYRQRSKSEWSNAEVRNRDLYQVTVRGLSKVLAVALWYALAVNLRRTRVLRRPGQPAVAVAPVGAVLVAPEQAAAAPSGSGPSRPATLVDTG